MNQIQEDTSHLLEQVKELQISVETLEKERNESLTLSNRLEQENIQLKTNLKTWKFITLGISCGCIAGGLMIYAISK